MKKIFYLIFLVIFFTSLSSALSENSEIIPKYEKEINFVMNGYPELENVTIFFIEKEIPHTMQSRPKLNFLFRSKNNREYKIISNNKLTESGGILFEDLSFEERVGVLSHEVGHVVDYEDRSRLGILFFAIKYMFENSKRKSEQNVDRITINHGFGKQLIAFSELAFYGEGISQEYKNKKNKYYYPPKELVKLEKNFSESQSL